MFKVRHYQSFLLYDATKERQIADWKVVSWVTALSQRE